MISYIIAVSKNGVIGKNGNLPWKITEDLKRFKTLTMGGVLFTGKKTAATLPKLPGREVIVLNRDTYPSIFDIQDIADKDNKIAWIIGGGQVYESALAANIGNRVYLTIIDQEFEGDTYFNFDLIYNSNWKLVSEEIIRNNDPIVKLQIWDRC